MTLKDELFGLLQELNDITKKNSTDYDYTEFNKLVKLCKEAEWAIDIHPLFDGQQVTLYKNGVVVDDAAIHYGTHGVKMGLLETYVVNKCKGFETGSYVFQEWKKLVAD